MRGLNKDDKRRLTSEEIEKLKKLKRKLNREKELFKKGRAKKKNKK